MHNPTQFREDDNRVFLRGRLAAEAVARKLPSGDELCVFRLVVARPPGARVRVDTVDCSTTLSRVRRTIARAEPGTVVQVSGCLRRRFWRGGAGLASRYEVEVCAARISSRPRNVA